MTRFRKAFVAASIVTVGALGAPMVSRLAHAGQYQVAATRKSSNLYKIDGSSMYVETRACFEFAFSVPAVLDASGSRGSLTFYSRGGTPKTCSVVGIYEEQAFSGKAMDAYGNLVDVSSLLVPVRLN